MFTPDSIDNIAEWWCRMDASIDGNGGPGQYEMASKSFTWLIAEVERLQSIADYCSGMGLTFGIMKTSDRPEGFLAHTWAENSDHERMFREWSESIGKIDKFAVLKAVDDEPEYPDDAPPQLCAVLNQAIKDKDLPLLLHAMRQTVRLTKECISARIKAIESV